MIVFSQICYSLHYSADGCSFALLCHFFSDFCRDESPDKDDFSGFDCPIIYDPLVDCCVEVEVFSLVDYSLETSHWIIHLR